MKRTLYLVLGEKSIFQQELSILRHKTSLFLYFLNVCFYLRVYCPMTSVIDMKIFLTI